MMKAANSFLALSVIGKLIPLALSQISVWYMQVPDYVTTQATWAISISR